MSQHLNSMPSRQEVASVDQRFINFGTITASDKETFLKNICVAFSQLSYTTNQIGYVVKATWSGHDYYIGEMTKSGSGNAYINFHLGTKDDIVSGQYYVNNQSITIVSTSEISSSYVYKRFISPSGTHTGVTLTFPGPNVSGKIMIASDSATRFYEGFYRVSSTSKVGLMDISKGENVTSITALNNVVTITFNAANGFTAYDMRISGPNAGDITYEYIDS